jgi:membrane protease YdiL (CAAX protease family)
MNEVDDLRPARVGANSELLDHVRPEERSVRRLITILLLGVPLGGLAALLTGAACILAACRLTGRSFDQLMAMSTGAAAGARGLLSYGFELSIAGLASIAFALALLLVAAKVQQRSAWTFLTTAPRLRGGLFVGGLVAGAVLVGGAVWIERLWSSQPPTPPILAPGADWGERAGYAALAAGFLFLAALAEEVLFRGWFVQQVAAWTRNLSIMLAVNGLVFSFVHFDPDLSGFIVRCLMGAGWAWIALRTGGIEFTTGAHLANNLLVSLFVVPVSFRPQPSAEVDVAGVAVEAGVIVLLVLVVEAWLRMRSNVIDAEAVREARSTP